MARLAVIDMALLALEGPTWRDKCVAAAIGSYADAEGKCWPSVQRLGMDVGADVQTVRKSIRSLISHDVLSKIEVGHGVPGYLFKRFKPVGLVRDRGGLKLIEGLESGGDDPKRNVVDDQSYPQAGSKMEHLCSKTEHSTFQNGTFGVPKRNMRCSKTEHGRSKTEHATFQNGTPIEEYTEINKPPKPPLEPTDSETRTTRRSRRQQRSDDEAVEADGGVCWPANWDELTVSVVQRLVGHDPLLEAVLITGLDRVVLDRVGSLSVLMLYAANRNTFRFWNDHHRSAWEAHLAQPIQLACDDGEVILPAVDMSKPLVPSLPYVEPETPAETSLAPIRPSVWPGGWDDFTRGVVASLEAVKTGSRDKCERGLVLARTDGQDLVLLVESGPVREIWQMQWVPVWRKRLDRPVRVEVAELPVTPSYVPKEPVVAVEDDVLEVVG